MSARRHFCILLLHIALLSSPTPTFQQTCSKTQNMDIDADDLASYNGYDESRCCEFCSNTPGCKGYSWNDYLGGTCWLKSTDGPLVPMNGVTTGIVGDSPPIGDKKVVCYYTNWSTYREGAQYNPSDIDPSLCTNIMYSFATLDPNSLTISIYDYETDIIQGFYKQVTDLKEHGLKVSIAIGGWSDSESDKYSRMINNPSSRQNFVTSVVNFLQLHNFDGLDLDWEYPVCWQGDCDAGPDSDKENFANLVKELRTAFEPHGFLLSAAVSASRSISDRAYDIPTLSQNLDWIGLMTYDYHGGYDGVTGHNSPFRGAPPSTVDTVDYWLSKGASKDKLIVGIPLYARSFTLENENNNGVGAPADTGKPGQYTGEDGFLAYFEVCNGWTYEMNPDVGPYAYKGDQWASYDDAEIIRAKASYIKNNELAGSMVWSIDTDDWDGRFCGKGSLLSVLRSELN